MSAAACSTNTQIVNCVTLILLHKVCVHAHMHLNSHIYVCACIRVCPQNICTHTLYIYICVSWRVHRSELVRDICILGCWFTLWFYPVVLLCGGLMFCLVLFVSCRASHASASLGRLHQDYHLQTPSDSPRAPHRHTPGRVVGQSVTPHRIPVGIVTSPGISAALRGKTACVPRVQGCHNSDRGKTACVPRVQGRHNSDRGKVNFRLTNKGCCDKVNERHPWADNLLLLPGSTQPVRMELGQFPSPATAPSGSHTEGVKNATEGVSDRLGVKNVTEGVSDRLGVKISGKYSGLEQRNIHQVAPLFIECDSRYVRRLDYFCPPHTEAYSNIAAHRNAACNTSHMANHARFDPRKSPIAGNGLLKQSRVQPMAKSQYENHIDSDQRKCITFDNVAYQDDSASYAKKTHCPLVLEGTAGHYNRHINSTNLWEAVKLHLFRYFQFNPRIIWTSTIIFHRCHI